MNDVHHKDVGLCGEREAVVQHLLQHLIHHHRVCQKRLLSAAAKIFDKCGVDAVQELNDEQGRHCGCCVGARFQKPWHMPSVRTTAT